MAARTRKTTLNDEWRAKIQATQILNRLLQCYEGKVELRPDQLKAINMVLDRTIPVLKNVEISHDPDSELKVRASGALTEQMLKLLTKEQLLELKKIYDQSPPAPPTDNDKPN